MTAVDVITKLFCRNDDEVQAAIKCPRANPYLSEVVTSACSSS